MNLKKFQYQNSTCNCDIINKELNSLHEFVKTFDETYKNMIVNMNSFRFKIYPKDKAANDKTLGKIQNSLSNLDSITQKNFKIIQYINSLLNTYSNTTIKTNFSYDKIQYYIKHGIENLLSPYPISCNSSSVS